MEENYIMKIQVNVPTSSKRKFFLTFRNVTFYTTHPRLSQTSVTPTCWFGTFMQPFLRTLVVFFIFSAFYTAVKHFFLILMFICPTWILVVSMLSSHQVVLSF